MTSATECPQARLDLEAGGCTCTDTCAQGFQLHHPECDGFIHHGAEAIITEFGTFKPACSVCGELPMVGSCGTKELALSFARAHREWVECDGRCLAWDVPEGAALNSTVGPRG